MPPFFSNSMACLYSYGTVDGYDDYGELKGEYTFREKVACDIQPLNPNDSLKEFGKILQDTYKIYLSSDVEVHDNDLLKIDNETYIIIGSPEAWNHILPYIKLTIQKQRKEIDG